MKKSQKKASRPEASNFQESLTFEDEGWSRLTSSEEDVSHSEATSSGKYFFGDSHTEYLGEKLVVSVHHFPMILCPFSPKVFVLPSEGSVSEAYLSAKHDDSLSPGLPPISTGVPPDGDDVPPGALLTAHFLYHLAAKVASVHLLKHMRVIFLLQCTSLFIIDIFLESFVQIPL